jgi:nitrile hydratase
LLTAGLAAKIIMDGRSCRLPDAVPARFKPGDVVVAKNIHPKTHTRLPRYVRGRRGIVARDYGVFVFPDTNAVFAGTKPQHLYSVRFSALELWGAGASQLDKVNLDLWDDYLEPFPGAAAS